MEAQQRLVLKFTFAILLERWIQYRRKVVFVILTLLWRRNRLRFERTGTFEYGIYLARTVTQWQLEMNTVSRPAAWLIIVSLRRRGIRLLVYKRFESTGTARLRSFAILFRAPPRSKKLYDMTLRHFSIDRFFNWNDVEISLSDVTYGKERSNNASKHNPAKGTTFNDVECENCYLLLNIQLEINHCSSARIDVS